MFRKAVGAVLIIMLIIGVVVGAPFSAEETALSQSTVFSSLYKLNQNGYVQSETVTTETGRQREIYSILPEGEAYYKSFLNDYNRHIKSVNQVLKSIV